MKYFIDTEFLEGKQDKRFLGIKYGKTKPTIDLISIGIVAEDGREYYAISKDFNLKEAWNRFDWKEHKPTHKEDESKALYQKVYWIRENVLKPIWIDLFKLHGKYPKKSDAEYAWEEMKNREKYIYLKLLLLKYGKTNKQIAEEIKEFVQTGDRLNNYYENETIKVDFYGYYADYDWVAFCWLFGNMIDLPKGFPMYCIDLVQELERCQDNLNKLKSSGIEWKTIKDIDNLKQYPNYPKQTNEHNALNDAKWNKELYQFIKSL